MRTIQSPLVRSYHSWIANESLEDYSLRYAARSFRKWSPFVIANTALGGISFLALEAIGGAITVSYGFQNAFPAIVVAIVFIFVTSLPIAYYSSRYNVDMDLLTRGAGFGYIGSTITSLIYATFTFVFFALEGAIMAQALKTFLNIPLAVGYLISSIVIIPITFMGVTMISRLQMVTQPLWIAMLLLPFVVIGFNHPETLQDWASYTGQESRPVFSVLSFGAALGVLLSLSIQIGEQVDFLRFLPDKTRENQRGWWAAMIFSGPGWVLIGGLKILFGSFLAVLAITAGVSEEMAVEPIQMYLKAYEFVLSDKVLVLMAAAVFVIISQVKINVTNAYAGSLAWSNFFSRATHYHPGRVVWLVFNIMISLLLMLLGVFHTLEIVLAIYSVIAAAWIGAIFADLAILKPLGVSPSFLEFRRAYLPNFNPVGCGAMAIATIAASVCFAGVLGAAAEAYAALIAFGISTLTAVLIGVATKGRTYVARPAHDFSVEPQETIQCELCGFHYEQPDMAYCPFYSRPICSLCCSLDSHCHDMCKSVGQNARSDASITLFSSKVAPHTVKRSLKVGGIFFALTVVVAAAILVTYRLIDPVSDHAALDSDFVLIAVFLALLPLIGIGSWWIVLSNESRELAERDLVATVEQLKQTQENLAASERLAAIGQITATVSHELRNPLGTLVNSAGILRRSRDRLDAATSDELDRLDRNAWRCVHIIDDLLDFSRSHSFKPADIDIDKWVRHAVSEFDVPQNKEVRLNLESNAIVHVDSERLRQAFSNVLRNALQACEEKKNADPVVAIATRVQGGKLALSVADNGVGMSIETRERMFEPLFSTKAFGVGLGMSIVKRIIEQSQGELAIESVVGAGTTITFLLPLAGQDRP